MHRLAISYICGSLHILCHTEAPVSSTSAHTQTQSCDNLGCGHAVLAVVFALCWTLWEGSGSHTHSSYLGTALKCGGKLVPELHTASQGKHLSDLCLTKPLLLTMKSNLFHGKRQCLKQAALAAISQSRNPQKRYEMNLSRTT